MLKISNTNLWGPKISDDFRDFDKDEQHLWVLG